MANGTSCEPEIDDVDLNKHDKKIENEQKFTCSNDSDKLKRSWSEDNCIKQSTRTAQPRKKSGKCNDMHSFAEGVATFHWDARTPLTKTEHCDLIKDKCRNSNHLFPVDVLKFEKLS